jgi:hypothetical protein
MPTPVPNSIDSNPELTDFERAVWEILRAAITQHRRKPWLWSLRVERDPDWLPTESNNVRCTLLHHEPGVVDYAFHWGTLPHWFGVLPVIDGRVMGWSSLNFIQMEIPHESTDQFLGRVREITERWIGVHLRVEVHCRSGRPARWVVSDSNGPIGETRIRIACGTRSVETATT